MTAADDTQSLLANVDIFRGFSERDMLSAVGHSTTRSTPLWRDHASAASSSCVPMPPRAAGVT